MKLVLLFGNEVIDLIKVRKTHISPARLLNLKQKLIVRNEENLNIASDEPQFALQNISAKNVSANSYVFI